MRTSGGLILVGVVALGSLLVACTKSPVAGGTTGTDTGNAQVKGILYNPDGKTPAAQAIVHIRKKSTLADTTGGGLAKSLADTATVITNDSGVFAIKSIDTGTYVIEGASGNNLALVDSVPIKSPDSTVTLPPDTLKPAGALKGVIRLSEGGDPRKVFILAFGIDRFARVNADGSFKFSGLAEGRYDLRLISSLDNYGVLDTNAVPVVSADTTDLDTIELPFTGIPTPKNVTIQYDTLRQIVTLSWDSANASLVSSYNVYRRNVGLNTVLARINTNPIMDTVYRDSTGVQDSTYEYRVVAVNGSTTEGTRSTAVSVRIVSAFQLIKTLNVANISTSIAKVIGTSTSKNIYLLSRLPTRCVFLLDSSGIVIDTLGKGTLLDPSDMIQDSIGNIYVGDMPDKKIFKFDSSGQLITSWNTISTPTALTLWDSLIIVGTVNVVGVELFNHNGVSINSFTLSEADMKGLAVDSNKYIFYYGDKTISKFTFSGTSIGSIYNTDLSQLTTYNSLGDLLNIGNSMLMFTLNKVLYIIDEKGNVISKLTSIGLPIGIHYSIKDKNIWIPDISTSMIRIYHLN